MKYCLFQILGSQFILWTSGPSLLPVDSSTAEFASIGALGGTGLAVFYLLLIIIQRNRFPEDLSSLGTLSAGSSILLKETVYSAVASIIGAYMRGRTEYHDQLMIGIAGALGPVVFLVLMFGSLGIIIAFAWSSRRYIGR